MIFSPAKKCWPDRRLFITMPLRLAQGISSSVLKEEVLKDHSWLANFPSAFSTHKTVLIQKCRVFVLRTEPTVSYTTPNFDPIIKQTWRWTSSLQYQEWTKNNTRKEQCYEKWILIVTNQLDSSKRPLSTSSSMPWKQMVKCQDSHCLHIHRRKQNSTGHVHMNMCPYGHDDVVNELQEYVVIQCNLCDWNGDMALCCASCLLVTQQLCRCMHKWCHSHYGDDSSINSDPIAWINEHDHWCH